MPTLESPGRPGSSPSAHREADIQVSLNPGSSGVASYAAFESPRNAHPLACHRSISELPQRYLAWLASKTSTGCPASELAVVPAMKVPSCPKPSILQLHWRSTFRLPQRLCSPAAPSDAIIELPRISHLPVVAVLRPRVSPSPACTAGPIMTPGFPRTLHPRRSRG